MELFERRRYYYCLHCGTFHFIETAARDGVQVLGPASARLPCPRCGGRLARSLLDESFTVDHCERCRGLLMTRATFAEAVTRRRTNARGAPAGPVALDPRELEHHVVCPGCHSKMDVHPYYGPGNVVIDTCSTCGLVWLDHAELKQISEAPGRDRGSKPNLY